jgi:hypothetical protein
MPRTIEVGVAPVSGAFTGFNVYVDHQLVISTMGGGGKGSQTTDKASVPVLVRAHGTSGSQFECTVKCPAHTSHVKVVHTLSAGTFNEDLNC